MNEAQRLTQLEERYAHLQRHVTEQDKAMLGLTEEIARLRKEITAPRSRVTSAPAEDAVDERPPHY
ncbi:MAG: SlyX family protein [Lacunisphaera sp.]|nr:SlyX family protein [Lacunisphaera sp.]